MAANLADSIFKYIFINEKFCILIQISRKFVLKGPIDIRAALVWILAWRRIWTNADLIHWRTCVAQGGGWDKMVLTLFNPWPSVAYFIKEVNQDLA